MFGKEKLVFEPAAAADTDNVGAYLRSADGTLLTHTTVAGKKGLDVNVINTSLDVTATNLDIRDLSHTQDNVAIAQGGNTLVVNADGSINVKADIDVVNGAEKEEDSAHVSGSIGQYVLAVRQDTLAPSTSADGDYASFKVNQDGALWVQLADNLVVIKPPTFTNWLVTQNTVDTTAELVVAADLTDRRKIIIQNVSSNRTVFLGQTNTVTSANGLRLSAGSAIELELAAGTAIYAIANAAGADLRIAELAA
jgi:hypothetical protein